MKNFKVLGISILAIFLILLSVILFNKTHKKMFDVKLIDSPFVDEAMDAQKHKLTYTERLGDIYGGKIIGKYYDRGDQDSCMMVTDRRWGIVASDKNFLIDTNVGDKVWFHYDYSRNIWYTKTEKSAIEYKHPIMNGIDGGAGISEITKEQFNKIKAKTEK
jgi:hypothetical protein